MADIIIKDRMKNMDFEKVTKMLSNAYWSLGVGIDEVIKSAQYSALVVGVFLDDTNQIGYARVVSDKTRFAYIADVYVDEPFRGKGIGREIINYILNHQELKGVYQWLLITKDAHGVYSEVGFKPISRPLDWMEIRNARSININM